MTSASLDVWRDTGYTEGCLEVPKTASTLSNPDYSFDGLEISTSSLFSEVKVKGAFAPLFDCSYLKMTYDMNNGDDVTVYGWIDSVAVGSDSSGSPMTRIQWHIDLWRTYISKVTLGSGIVKRRTAEGTLPTQPYGNRYTISKTPHELFTPSTIYWVFLNITKTVEGVSTTTTYCYPVDKYNPTTRLNIYDMTDNAYSPSFVETVNGAFDELFALDPDAIFSAFMSPLPPNAMAVISGSYLITGWKIEKTQSTGSETYGAFVADPAKHYLAYVEEPFTTMAQTSDTVSYAVTDFDREPIGVLPWGLSVNGGYYRIVNADVSMYLVLRFTTADITKDKAAVNGLEFAIPLKTIGVTANAKSSYVYSGQQELDREQMAIQRTQALQSGLVNIGNSAVQGAMGGALLGAIGGPVGVAGGAVIGGVSSVVGGIIGTAGEYAISGVTNDKLLDATIRQKAQQTNGLMLPSSGTDWVNFGAMPMLIPLQWDDYSITQRSQDMSLYGAHVDEPRTSCQSLLTAGGPLQIVNCTVTGAVPVQAKRYIKERLSNGVRIV